MNNLQKWDDQSGKHIQESDQLILASIALAFERVNLPVGSPNDLMNILKDVKMMFPIVDHKEIIEGIKMGALGYYGRTYRMSSQEVCIWVREYLKPALQPRHEDQLYDHVMAHVKKYGQ